MVYNIGESDGGRGGVFHWQQISDMKTIRVNVLTEKDIWETAKLTNS